ncbi:MAG: HAD family hydrolase [Limisphaerales bacterium]
MPRRPPGHAGPSAQPGRGTDFIAGTEAIIFDMDGVIVDSEPLHEQAFREIFAAMGCGETHGMDFAHYYGESDRALWLDFVAKHRPPQPLEELLDWKQRHFIAMLRRHEPIFGPVPPLVERLAARWPLAVASGSLHPVIDEVLALRGLRRFFSTVVSVQDVGRGKPAPDVFLLAAERLGMPPSACVVLEDSAAGVTAARAAGMRVIAITNSLPAAQLAHADAVVDDYAEVGRRLLGTA